MQDHDLLDERSLSKLRWRCRRGLLENDLILERFFQGHAGRITVGQARGLTTLMDLTDNDLLDILLGRTPLSEALATDPAVVDMVHLLRSTQPSVPAT